METVETNAGASTPEDDALGDAQQLLEQGIQCYLQRRQLDAIETLELARSRCEENALTEHECYARVLTNLAAAHASLARYRLAESLYLRAIRAYEKVLGPDDEYLGKLRVRLEICREWGDTVSG